MSAIYPRRFLFLLVFCFAAHAADERIQAGPLSLDVYISRTAALFHVVDQLSEWNYYTHKQYKSVFDPLTATDQAMLAKHRAVRAKHSWGEGLEQTFYSPLALDEALQNGVKQGWLTADEASIEREVLVHFSARIDALFTQQANTLTSFRERLRHELGQQAATIASFARFTGHTPSPIPVYLLPNPDINSFGGGYNGGRLTLEVPAGRDVIPYALHEVFHVFLKARENDINAATTGIPGLDAETLNEGMAYAFCPGIVHDGPAETDPLVKEVKRDYASGKSLTDPYVRFNRYGLALRPLLKAALVDDRQTLTTFLPRAIDIWRAVHELELATAESELKTVTIIRIYRADSPELPDWVKKGNAHKEKPSELYIASKEWVKGSHLQMRAFSKRASHEFLLVAPDHPDIRAHLDGHMISSGDGKFQAYGLEVADEDRSKIVPGATYRIKPLNTNDTYRWQIAENLASVKLRG